MFLQWKESIVAINNNRPCEMLLELSQAVLRLLNCLLLREWRC